MNSLISRIKLKAKMFDLPEKRNQAYWQGVDDVGNIIDSLPMVEAYTKDEVVDMLDAIQLEIAEVKTQSGFDCSWDGAVGICVTIIQEKINELRGKEND